ncbi:cation diffusion facilitator transporter family protein [Synechococcus sp. A15-127]|uniref:cation diffusion facilitator family transporter n=1 Tax=Synechococcus sp. A15-127 TaxID=1050624 RepID=UPI00164555EB|nr:cation diffusion facilitator family transporter [Synechococcus sp. A15-127]QNI94204.1 cation diffusion facilitator transporter family protein [Synechococcus sp. A15-127]
MATSNGRIVTGRGGDRRNSVRRVLTVALALNISMSLLKLTIGLVSGSLAVIADAMHSATDALSSLTGLITNNLSDPRPDRDHPYGHHKYEAIGALGIAGFILFTALEILLRSGERVLEGLPAIRVTGQELLLLLLVLGLNLLLAGYEHNEGRRLDSALLKADAQHAASDVWTTVVVLVGMAGTLWLKVSWLDIALAIPMALLLIRVCWQVLRRTLPWLVDHIAIAPEAIHAEAMGVPGVINCHDIASRGVLGQQVFIDMHMVVEADDLATAHSITERVEERLDRSFGPVRCTIHLEPKDYVEEGITYTGTHG